MYPTTSRARRGRRLGARLGIVCASAVGVLGLIACGAGTTSVTGSSNSGNVSGPVSSPVATATTSGPKRATVGQTVTVDEADGTHVAVTLNSARVTAPGPYDSVPDTQTLVLVKVTLKNLGQSEYSYGAYAFGARDAGGNISDVQFLSDLAPDEMTAGTLAPGGTVSGVLILEVPKGDHTAALTWQPSPGDARGAVLWQLGV